MPAVDHPSTGLPDRYRVTRRIAAGGMATVYACEDTLLGRLVAVKVLAPHFAADANARARFQREARAAARVSDHPHVATIYDIGEDEGVAFITMEYFSGGTVGDRLRSGDPIPRPLALRWLEETASALDHAHRQGIVHRDVKPANLLLDAHGRLAVADFGIARMVAETGVTASGTVMGTAAYLSPEQALGEPATAASDRYALAVVAYELLTGGRPFNAEHAAAQARAHVEAEPPPANLNDAADRALARGLDKDPDARWPTAAALVEALDDALGDQAAPAVTPEPTLVTRRFERTPTPPPRRPAAPRSLTEPPRRRRRWAPFVVAALVLGLIAGGAIAALGGGGDSGAEQAASTPKQRTTKKKKPVPEQTQSTPAAAAPAQTTADTTQTTAATPTSGDPAALNAQGFDLMNQGRYAEAVPVLQKAIENCPVTQTDPCGYAYFNLGRSLLRAGRAQEAIPVLQQRLQNPNQKGVVKKELKAAQKAAGQG
jgi:serine/threonine protein kinase